MNQNKEDISKFISSLAPCCGGIRDVENGPLNEIGKLVTLSGIKNILPAVNSFCETIGLNFSEILKYDEAKNTNFSAKIKTIFDKYGSDKALYHSYHLPYGEIFKDLNPSRKLNILEIGIGSNNPKIASFMSNYHTPGSSLRALKEIFPNSQIFGADLDKDILFEEERIKTSFVDQLNASSFEEMHENFNKPKYDLIIEDGLHSIPASLNTLNFALKNTNDNGVIVLEDLCNDYNIWAIISSLLFIHGYNSQLITESTGLLLVIKNKPKRNKET